MISVVKHRRVDIERRLNIQPRLFDPVDVDQQFPSPPNGLLLEVVPEAPAAQHLKESVVIGVLAHVLQVVVLAPRANALLAVGRSGQGGQLGAWGGAPQKDGLELVHAGVGEEQRGVVEGHARRGGHERVLQRGE
eukprot:CCRYP_016874-RA/>CCRYP_016874-RA protein AED:0.21 eAED:0.34 QI:764/0/0.5/1/0/0/2/0/134